MNTIEPLESRIAPAVVVAFTDLDGDLVTISASKGTLAELQTAAGNVNDHVLQTLDLSGTDHFDGTNISIIATPLAGKGDGLVNVGYINATGRVLGVVTVDGDLGAIDVGNTAVKPVALASLTVQSLGELGTTTGAPADLRSDIAGSVKSILVKGNVRNAYVDITGANPATLVKSSLGSLTIVGSLIGGSSAAQGVINVTGNIGPVKVGGSVLAGAGIATGQIGSLTGSVGAVTIGGDVIGSVAGFSGYIFADIDMGNVTVGGDVRGTGGANGNSGLIIAAKGSMGNVKVGGSLIGGNALYSGTIVASTDAGATGSMGKVTIGGSVIGGAAFRTGALYAAGGIGAVSIGGDLKGGAGDESGLISSGGSVGSVKIGGDVRGGGFQAGRIFGRNIGSVSIGGSLIGGGGSNSGTIQIPLVLDGSVQKVGAITIGGSVLGGAGSYSGGLLDDGLFNDVWGPIKVGGDWIGGSGGSSGRLFAGKVASVTIDGSFIGGSNTFAGYWTGNSIGSVTIGGDVVGGSAIQTASFSYPVIKRLTIGGSLIGGTATQSGVILGSISSLTIGHDIRGADSGASNLEQTGGIFASQLGTVTIGGSIIAGHKTGAGTLKLSGSVVSGRIGSLTVKGSVVGNTDVPAQILTIDGMKSLTVGGRVEYGLITAGLDLDQNPSNADAQIGTVKVSGDWIASSLIAGVNPTNGRIGDGNDTRLVGAFVDDPDVIAKIARITIGGQVLGILGNPTKTFGFGSEEIGSFKVGGTALPLHAGRSTEKFAGAGLAGNAIPVGFTPGNIVNDGFAIHVFEV
jgi:hypothetical protein